MYQAAPDRKVTESAIRILPDLSRYASSQGFAGEEDSDEVLCFVGRAVVLLCIQFFLLLGAGQRCTGSINPGIIADGG